MKNGFDYFIRIAYDGTAYGGWQQQANHSRTIQQTIEESLSTVLGREIAISGCGRTDAGVHASQFYFYLNNPTELPTDFLFFMNKSSPADIAFLDAIPVTDKAHVCIDATLRTYDYFFHDFADAWLSRTSSQIDLSNFRPELTAQAIPQILTRTNFREFCLTPDRLNSTIVNFSSVTLFRDRKKLRYRIRFVADRFLRGMIRILVSDLVKIGTEEMSIENFIAMLDVNARGKSVRLAPPNGLFLTGVSYPYITREPDLPDCGQREWESIPS